MKTIMSAQSFKWRTAAEFAVISAVIYLLVGAPGFPKSLIGATDQERAVPVSQAKIDSLVYPSKELRCPDHNYNIRIFASSPLIIYIDNFISEEEAKHLIQLRFATDLP